MTVRADTGVLAPERNGGLSRGPLRERRWTRARVSTFVDRRVGLFFAGPAVVLLVGMIVIPMIYTGYLSFHRWNGGLVEPLFIGFENYVALFTNPRFLGGLLRTAAFAIMAVGVETVLGVVIALLINRRFRGRRLVQSLFLLPVIATPVAIALVWRFMYQPDLGVLNKLLAVVGIPPSNWVADSTWALPLIAVVDIWQWTGFIVLMTLTALIALPSWPYEAAAMDGASRWQVLWYVTLPLIRPVVIAAVVFRTIDALKTFDLIMVITGGGPGNASETIDLYAYRATFEYQQLGYASAMLIVFFILIGIVSGLLARLRKMS